MAALADTIEYTVIFYDANNAQIGDEITVARGQTVAAKDIPDLPAGNEGYGNYIDEGDDGNHIYYTWDSDPATTVIESNTIFSMVKNTEEHDYQSGFVFREDAKTGIVYQSVCSKCGHLRQYGVKLDLNPSHISVSQGIPYELTIGDITQTSGYLDITTAKPIISVLEKVGIIPAGTGTTINTVIDIVDKIADVADKIIENTSECAKNGHLYGEPVYTWNQGNTECTATFTCKREACHDNYTNHTFTKKMNVTGPVYTYGNCTVDGTETYTATCKFTDTNIGSVDGFDADHDFVSKNVIIWQPKTGHKWTVRVSNNDATCTEDGTFKRICANCGEVQDNIPDPGSKKGHTPGALRKENEVAATCKAGGSYDAVRRCVRCNILIDGDDTGHIETDKLDHVELPAVKENEIPADCENAGSYDSVVYCKNCGEELSRDTVPVPAKGHKRVIVAENQTFSTCTVSGKYDKVTKCSVCGKIDSRETVTLQTANHDWDTVETKAPTCGEDGEKAKICRVCGTPSGYTEAIPHLEHEYEETVVEPTCSSAGYTVYTCKYCGDSYEGNEVSSLSHVLDEGNVTKDETCEEKGTKVYTCTLCGTKVTTEIPKKNHNWVLEATVPAGCTEIGYTKYKCSKCQEEKIENITEPTGHKEASPVTENSIPAKCLTDGSYDNVYYCEYCQEELRRETKTIKAKGHKYSNRTDTTATCTEQGYSMYKCSDCGFEYKAKFTPCKGHKPKTIPAVAATCTTTGLTAGKKCSVCGVILEKQKDTPIVDHSWDKGVITKQPTVDETGIRTYTCTVCSETKTKVIPKLTLEEATPTDSEADNAHVNKVIKKPAGITTKSHLKKKSLDIFFKKVDGAQNYRIMYRKQGDKKWNYAWTDGKTQYTLKNLKNGGLYEFMFVAYEKNANDEWERGQYSKTSYRYYYKENIKKVKAGKKSATVKWTRDKSGNGYELFYSTNKQMDNKKKIVISDKKTTSYKIKGLKKGKKYYIRVRSIKKKAGKNYIGEFSSQKTVKVK